MKRKIIKLHLAIVFFLLPFLGYAQIFEGIIGYDIQYDVDSLLFNTYVPKEVQEEISSKTKPYDKIYLFVKDSLYMKRDNSKKRNDYIYNGKDTIYHCKENSKRVRIIDSGSHNTMELSSIQRIVPSIYLSDTTATISGIRCNLLILDFILNEISFGKEYYWFNSDTLKVDFTKFHNHNYGYLNQVLKLTKSWPVSFTKLTENFGMIKHTLTYAKRSTINPSFFTLPTLDRKKRSTKGRASFEEEVYMYLSAKYR